LAPAGITILVVMMPAIGVLGIVMAAVPSDPMATGYAFYFYAFWIFVVALTSALCLIGLAVRESLRR
jgi:hypothetical protein